MKWLIIALTLALSRVEAQTFAGNKVRGVLAGPVLTNVVPDLLWWKLNEGTGTSITGDAATSDDGITDAAWAAGRAGQCLNFNGTSSDAATTGTVAWGTNVMTICGWLYIDDSTTDRLIWSSTDADVFGAGVNSASVSLSGGNLYGRLFGDTGYRQEYIGAPAVGVWTHVLMVFDGSTETGNVKIIIGGAEQSTTVATDTHDGTANFATAKFTAGQRAGGTLFYDGKMDDVRVYSGDQSAIVANIASNPQ